MNSRAEVTQLLLAWNNGDREALDALMLVVYEELRRLARHQMKLEAREHTLQPTVLVNEAYLRLVDQKRVSWQNRAHFFGVASQIIRRILVDHARARHRLKRGGKAIKMSLDDSMSAATNEIDTIDLDQALQKLEDLDPDQGRIVELRFFGGLNIEETAEAIGVSTATVKRDWAIAKGWLLRELTGAGT